MKVARSLLSEVSRLRNAYRTVHKFDGGLGSLVACALGTAAGEEDHHAAIDLTVLTFTICPPLARLWHHFAANALEDVPSRLLIGDSTGLLQASDFPGARLQRLLNITHVEKIDLFVHVHTTSRLVLLCDDDVFLKNSEGVKWAIEQLRGNKETAAVSLKPRQRFVWPLDGTEYMPMGTYCLLFRADLFRDEQLSFRAVHEPSPTPLSYRGEYDTGDFANVELIKRGYEIQILPPALQSRTYFALNGMSYPIVALRRVQGDLTLISPSQYETLYRSLRLHSGLREIYREVFGTLPAWSILPDGAEQHFVTDLAGCMSASQTSRIDLEVAQQMDRLRILATETRAQSVGE